MFERIWILVEFITSLGVWPTYIFYYLTAKILPDWASFADGHIWWHNLIIAVIWIGIYLAGFILFRRYARQQMDMLHKRAWHNYGIKLFAGWQKWCSMLFVFGFILVPYLKLPRTALIITCGCGVAVLIYDIKKAKQGIVFVLLQQIYLSFLSAVYLILFAPIIYVLCLITIALLFFKVGMNDIFSPKIMVTTFFSEFGTPVRTERETM